MYTCTLPRRGPAKSCWISPGSWHSGQRRASSIVESGIDLPHFLCKSLELSLGHVQPEIDLGEELVSFTLVCLDRLLHVAHALVERVLGRRSTSNSVLRVVEQLTCRRIE